MPSAPQVLTQFINPRSHLLQYYGNCRTIFLCCDIQDRLRPFISNYEDAIAVSNKMAAFHTALTPAHSTFLVTEQMPEKIGPVSKDIQLPPGTPVFGKVQPSMLIPEVLPYVDGDVSKGILPVQQAVLWGHESHVCILNTADALLQKNIRVAVLVDGCASQLPLDHEVALKEMSRWEGLTLTTSVSAMLQMTRNEARIMKPLFKLTKVKPTEPSRS